MSDFDEVTKQIADSLVQNGPKIKIGFGLASGVLALGMAVYGTYRATKKIMIDKPETTKEQAIIFLKCVGPAVAAEGLSVFLTLKGVKGIENEKQQALDAAAAAGASAILAKEALKIKDEAIKETCDEKTQKDIRDKVAQKRLDYSPIQDRQVTMAKQPQQLFHDMVSDRYFMSSMQEVEDCFKSLEKKMIFDQNHRYNGVGFIGANEYFWELGLEELDVFKPIGWREDIDGPLRPDFSPGFATDGRTCVNIEICPPDTSYWELAKNKIGMCRFP